MKINVILGDIKKHVLGDSSWTFLGNIEGETTNWMGKHREGRTDGQTVSIHCKYHQTVAVILPVTLIDNPAGLSQVSVLLQVCEGGVTLFAWQVPLAIGCEVCYHY